MSVSANFYRRFQAGQDFLEATEVVTDGAQLTISEDVAVTVTDTFDCPISITAVSGLWVSTNVDGTVFTFDGGPDAFTIDAATPLVWTADSNLTMPLTADCMEVSVHNVSAVSIASVNIRVLFNPA